MNGAAFQAYVAQVLLPTLSLGDIVVMDELLPVWWTLSLSCRRDPLEFHRADIANGRVSSAWVVEAFDIFEHIGPSLVSRPVNLAGNPFGFE